MTIQEINVKIRNIIAFEKYNASNDRAAHIAKFCQLISAGQGEAEHVKELRPSEEPQQKENRAKVYYSLAQYSSNKMLGYIRRLKSVEDVKIEVLTDNENNKTKITNSLINFYDEKNLLEYLIELYANMQGTDPNALILLTQTDIADDLGNVIDRKVEPIIIPHFKVVEVSEKNGKIEYGIIKEQRQIQHTEKLERTAIAKTVVQKTVTDLYFYQKGLSIIFIRDTSEFENVQEIDLPPYELTGLNFDVMQVEKPTGETETYKVYVFENENLPCPLVAVSGGKDKINPKVKTSLLAKAERQFMELVSRKSELDVNTVMHIYPQKYVVIPECSHVDHNGNECEKGTCGGKTCTKCKGTGEAFHISGQDVITVKIPKGATKEDIPEISKMVYYVEHDQYIHQAIQGMINVILAQISDSILETNVFSAVTYNSTQAEATTPKNGIAVTATQTMIDWQRLYLSLKDCAEHIEKMYSLFADYQTALIVSEPIKVRCNFPKDFKFATLSELIEEYKKAIDSQLPYDVVEKITAKIIEKQSPDDAISMKWALMKLRLKPFSGKSESEVRAIVENRANDDIERVLWENYDTILDLLRDDNEALITQDYKTQNDAIRAKAAEYLTGLKFNESNNINSLFDNVNN